MILSHSCSHHPHLEIRLDVVVENYPQKLHFLPGKTSSKRKFYAKQRSLSPLSAAATKLSFMGEFREAFSGKRCAWRPLLASHFQPCFSDFGKEKNLISMKTSHRCSGRIQIFLLLLFCSGMVLWAQRGEEPKALGNEGWKTDKHPTPLSPSTAAFGPSGGQQDSKVGLELLLQGNGVKSLHCTN